MTVAVTGNRHRLMASQSDFCGLVCVIVRKNHAMMFLEKGTSMLEKHTDLVEDAPCDVSALLRWLRYISIELDEGGLASAAGHCVAAIDAIKRSLIQPASLEMAAD